MADYKVAIERIETLFNAPELDELPADANDKEYAITIDRGEFVWEGSDEKSDTASSPPGDKLAKERDDSIESTSTATIRDINLKYPMAHSLLW